MGRTDHLPFSGLTVEDATSFYVSSRKDRMRPVSISAALRAIREVCPNAPQTDCEIVTLLASKASVMGLTVDFDLMEVPEEQAAPQPNP